MNLWEFLLFLYIFVIFTNFYFNTIVLKLFLNHASDKILGRLKPPQALQ